MRRQEKLRRAEEFLRYGGNELFSTLMGDEIIRSLGLERLRVLLCREVQRPVRRGPVGMYRRMVIGARRRGWLRAGYRLDEFRLTERDRDRVLEGIREYLESGGALGELWRRCRVGLAIVLVLGLGIAGVWRYMLSDTYRERLYGAQVLQGVEVRARVESAEPELLVLAIRLEALDLEELYLAELPVVEFGGRELHSTKYYEPEVSGEGVIGAEEKALYLEPGDYGLEAFPGRYRVLVRSYVNGAGGPVEVPEVVVDVSGG